MKPLLSVLALSSLVFACDLQAHESRELVEELEIEPGQRLRIELPVAELEIEAGDRENVRAELTIRCRWQLDDCEETLEELELRGRSTSRRLSVELAGLPRWHSPKIDIEGTFFIPRTAPLEVKMGVAELDITGVETDLRVDVGVGEVRVWLTGEKVGRASLDAGVGEVELLGAEGRIHGRRSLLVGNEVHWDDGSGEARVDIEVGVGEIIVWLE